MKTSKRIGKTFVESILLFNLVLLVLVSTAQAQNKTNTKTENLAFKVLEKRASEYETSLSTSLFKSLSRYIPQDRFHLAVRIFWNPSKLEGLKNQQQALTKKEGKLPGFQIFVKEEQSLDYYLGSESVLKLKVNVLLDKNLPERYEEFVYKFVPIQARFVAERGDTVTVSKIAFPKSTTPLDSVPEPLDQDVPLTNDQSTEALVNSVEAGAKEFLENPPVLVHPIIQKYISGYEEYIKGRLEEIIDRYVDPEDYVLSVKFYWNPEELHQLNNLIVSSTPKSKVKLPGFNIYVEEENAIYDIISNSATLLYLEVTVLLNETVEEEVDAFLRQVIPLSFKFNAERGDRLIIRRGKFPKKQSDDFLNPDDSFLDSSSDVKLEEPTSDLSGDVSMDATEDTFLPREDSSNDVSTDIMSDISTDIPPLEKESQDSSTDIPQDFPFGNEKEAVTYTSAFQELRKQIVAHFESGELQDALDLVEQNLSTENELELFELYQMKGSIHLILQQIPLAIESWEEALILDPEDQETYEILKYIKEP